MKIDWKNDDGVALIWASLIMLLLVFFAALVIDTGFMVVTRGQLQTAADAAALAGAQVIRQSEDDARDKAAEIGLLNSAAGVMLQLDANAANSADGDIVVGTYDSSTRTFTPTTTSPNAVMVNARRTEASANGAVQLIMADMMNSTFVDADIQAYAVATVGAGFGAGVIALNEDEPCSFDIKGTAGSLIVDGGVIYVNSDDASAACHSGKPYLDADGVYSAGGFDNGFEEQVNYDGPLYPGSNPIADPLAELPEPVYDPASSLGTVNVTSGDIVNIGPGYYDGGITMHNGELNLTPGVYILDGAGLDINGGTLNAEGVIFYIAGGPVDIRGNMLGEITPPDEELYGYPGSPDITPYADSGVSIFQGRTNTSDSRILGTATMDLEGTMYFPVAEIEIGGNSTSFGNGLIADTILAHGNGTLTINYLGQFNNLGGTVSLVE